MVRVSFGFSRNEKLAQGGRGKGT